MDEDKPVEQLERTVLLSPFRVERIEIHYYKRFEKLEIEFPAEGPVVIVGGNGAGKSSVLEAVDICLSWVAKRLASGSSGGRYPEEEDINDGSKWSLIRIQVNIGGHSMRWAVGKSRRGYAIDYPSDIQSINEYTKTWRQENSDQDEIGPMPFLYYYKVNRSITEVPRRLQEPKDTSRFSVYSSGRSGYNLNFRDFLWWFKQQQAVEDQERVQNPQLQLVRDAIAAVVPGFSDPTVIMKTNEFFVYSSDRSKKILLNELSDGQRTLLTLVADIAKRGAIALGDQSNVKLVDIFGVVLIDEIELHLHPTWQNQIIESLSHAFPKIQFIATTHSTAILTNVADRNSFSLEKGVLYSPKSYGRTANALMEDVFDTPQSASAIVEAFDALNKLIDEERFAEAREALDIIRIQLPDDERTVSADVMLWMPDV